jgi:hypothetical protein
MQTPHVSIVAVRAYKENAKRVQRFYNFELTGLKGLGPCRGGPANANAPRLHSSGKNIKRE